MRTIIDLTDEQIERLKSQCRRERISRAEAIRQAVDRWLEVKDAGRADWEETLDETFGAWADKGVDTDTYLAEIRSEWER